jgi:hypothetical protein
VVAVVALVHYQGLAQVALQVAEVLALDQLEFLELQILAVAAVAEP